MTQREDESLIDEMREAIRGDRERAAARSAWLTDSAEAAQAAPIEPSARPEPERRPLVRRLLGR